MFRSNALNGVRLFECRTILRAKVHFVSFNSCKSDASYHDHACTHVHEIVTSVGLQQVFQNTSNIFKQVQPIATPSPTPRPMSQPT